MPRDVKVNQRYKVKVKFMNVRDMPNDAAKIMDTLLKDQEVDVTEVHENGWLRTNQGWVRSNTEYIELLDTSKPNIDDPSTNPGVTKNNTQTIKDKLDEKKNRREERLKDIRDKKPTNFDPITNPDGTVKPPDKIDTTTNHESTAINKDATNPNGNSKTKGDLSGELGNTSNKGDDASEYNPDANDYALYSAQNQSSGGLKRLKGAFGMPYQFLSSTDKKLSEYGGSDFPYGRKYTEKIINRMPLLLIAPGTPAFMHGFKKSMVSQALQSLIDVGGGGESSLEQLFSDTGKTGRYYTFRFNYSDYFDYVNGMCRAAAIYMGLGGEKFNGTSLRHYDWSTYSGTGPLDLFSGSQFMSFYVDADNQVSESFSNSTKESLLDRGLNGLSDLGKEIDFLLGAGIGMQFDMMNEEKVAQGMADAANQLISFSNPSNVISRFVHGAKTIVAGGQLIFPEIWADSSYSKSYSVTLKLSTPNGDDMSVYKDILVPTFHILGFVLPLQMGYNGYRSPFLVKAIYKSMFNIEYGMVTGCSISRGTEGSWNVNGLPTEVTINLDIKDLYQILSMTKQQDTKMFFNNTQYLDFIANMCGIAIIKPEVMMKAEMYAAFKANTVLDLPNKALLKLRNTATNIVSNALRWAY